LELKQIVQYTVFTECRLAAFASLFKSRQRRWQIEQCKHQFSLAIWPNRIYVTAQLCDAWRETYTE